MQLNKIRCEFWGFRGGVISRSGNQFANMPDDVFNLVRLVVPFARRAWFLCDQHRFITASVVPSHAHWAFIPDHHLLEIKIFVEPERPPSELRVRSAAAAAAAAAASRRAHVGGLQKK